MKVYIKRNKMMICSGLFLLLISTVLYLFLGLIPFERRLINVGMLIVICSILVFASFYVMSFQVRKFAYPKWYNKFGFYFMFVLGLLGIIINLISLFTKDFESALIIVYPSVGIIIAVYYWKDKSNYDK